MIDKSIGVLLAIVTLASLAVILSKKSNTAKVLEALLGGLSKNIKTAVSPVTG